MARCYSNHVHDAHRPSGMARRQTRGLAGACQRRTIPVLSVKTIFVMQTQEFKVPLATDWQIRSCGTQVTQQKEE
ncbi:MAG: hypothetical protein V7K43_07610 [Nostoc sp.]